MLRRSKRRSPRSRTRWRCLKLHYLRWVLFPIKGETYFMYQGIFDTDFDKYTEDAVALFGATGIKTVFENLEGFPMDWKTNPASFVKFVREHQCPSFLEYGGISVCERRRNQEGAEAEGRVLDHARPDAMMARPRRCSTSTIFSTSC